MSQLDFAWIEGNLTWLLPILIGDAILRGYSLWRASHAGRRYWFVALFIINSLGILPLIYLFFIDKKAVKNDKKVDKR